jgi:hypothetical protein
MEGEVTRPVWDFHNVSEEEFRRIYNLGIIVSVTAKREMTGVDTAREWMEVTNANGDTAIMPQGWKSVWDFVGLSSYPGLFKMSYMGSFLGNRMAMIDKFEADNTAERAEFDRLKAKFEPSK